MESKYEWKMKSFAKKVDPEKAILEIEKAEALFGKITAENVLKIAQDENSALHSMFEWDDSKAAENYRLSQARTLINNIEVKIISNGESRSIPVYEIVRIDNSQQYKNIETLSYNEIEQVKENTIRAINGLKSKLTIYKQFHKVLLHLDSAVNELSEVETE